MSKENSYQAVILKKMPYGEGDEILTFYTKEAGKVRALAKSSKFAKSKLQYALQILFLVKVSLAGLGLPKIIGIEVINPFAKLRGSFEAAKISFYALELVLKFTPDEHKNEKLFELLEQILKFLDSASIRRHPESEQSEGEGSQLETEIPRSAHSASSSWPRGRNDASEKAILDAGLAKFKIEFLESLGLGIHHPANLDQLQEIGFSNSRGGFLPNQDGVDCIPVSPQVLPQFLALKKATFGELASETALNHNLSGDLTELQSLLAKFLTYQLEREIKSEKYLKL